jgi:hypothetical protein
LLKLARGSLIRFERRYFEGDLQTGDRSQMTESATEMRATLEDIDQQLSVIDERTESGSDTNVLAHAVHNLVRIVDNIVISLER